MKKLSLILSFLLVLQSLQAQKISRLQASSDIDSLMYVLTEVHPNIYSNVSISSLAGKMNEAKSSLPDSITQAELYIRLAPIVALVGDSHTSLVLPYESLMSKVERFMPIYPTIDSNSGRLYVKATANKSVPYDSEIISINGVKATEMVEKMKSCFSGERTFFQLIMTDNNVMPLFHYLYSAEQYDIVFRAPKGKKEQSITLTPMTPEEFESNLMLSPKLEKFMTEHNGEESYSYRILDDMPVAVMNFDACQNPKGMERFAKEMFATLKTKGIKHLIIDARYNGGGNSRVGDIVLSYISPRPFHQFGQTYIRVTPTTHQLGSELQKTPGIYFTPEDTTNLRQPLDAESHYDGKVTLLTSHTTFSSAASFAWAFEKYGCGRVIGEETGGMNVHYGDVLTYTLPHSALSCNISHKRFWQPGAEETDIHGLIPHIVVEQDKALDKALEMIRKGDK